MQKAGRQPIPLATTAYSLLNDGSVTAVVIFPDMIRGSPFHSTNNNRVPTGPARRACAYGAHGGRLNEASGTRQDDDCLNEALVADRGDP